MNDPRHLAQTARLLREHAVGDRVFAALAISYIGGPGHGFAVEEGTLGTVFRRVMAALYVIRWDSDPATECPTSADSFDVPRLLTCDQATRARLGCRELRCPNDAAAEIPVDGAFHYVCAEHLRSPQLPKGKP
ncbi:MAG: hypothetical protein ACRDNM_00085 [Gaiellaceae bacterium]